MTYARPYVDMRPAELVLEIGDESTRLQFGPSPGTIRAEFLNESRTRVARLFEVVATKLNLPPTTQPLGLLMAKGGASSQPPTPGNTPLSEDLVRVVLDPEASITLDGRPYVPEDEYPSYPTGGAMSVPSSAGGMGGGQDSPMSSSMPLGLGVGRKRRRLDSPHGTGPGGVEEWIVRTGQWRLRIQAAKNGKAAVECVLVAVKLDAMSAEQARNSQRVFLGG